MAVTMAVGAGRAAAQGKCMSSGGVPLTLSLYKLGAGHYNKATCVPARAFYDCVIKKPGHADTRPKCIEIPAINFAKTDLANVVEIEDGAFERSSLASFGGDPKGFSKLRRIGKRAFREAADDNQRNNQGRAYRSKKGYFINFVHAPELTEVDDSAFEGYLGALTFMGAFPKLQRIGAKAFAGGEAVPGSKIAFPNGLPRLTHIAAGAFNGFKGAIVFQMGGTYPTLPGCFIEPPVHVCGPKPSTTSTTATTTTSTTTTTIYKLTTTETTTTATTTTTPEANHTDLVLRVGTLERSVAVLADATPEANHTDLVLRMGSLERSVAVLTDALKAQDVKAAAQAAKVAEQAAKMAAKDAALRAALRVIQAALNDEAHRAAKAAPAAGAPGRVSEGSISVNLTDVVIRSVQRPAPHAPPRLCAKRAQPGAWRCQLSAACRPLGGAPAVSSSR